jgi:N utilization substance protein B
MSSRRKARELALKTLYQKDTSGSVWEETFEYISDFLKVSDEGKKFAKNLVEGTLKNINEVDSRISKFSKNWTLSRISVVDRNILRLACYEMLFEEKIPHAVSIDEAIELSKKYSSQESKSFINGVLDAISKSLNKKE